MYRCLGCGRAIRINSPHTKADCAAEEMLSAITVMAIDGWLTEEYDLPDQQRLRKAAKSYLHVRSK